MITFPTKRELMDSIIDVLNDNNNGSMKTADIDSAVAKKLKLPQELLSIESNNCSGTEYSYRMRWARTELKQKHIIDNPSRGIWTLI